ncbi:hypothetical protein D9613_012393 [Agrocybe pediades]|uniref:Ribonuclease H1 N-terminal domain-containing protein n=1 Tax=Agrocybe pediades TaxID=84607 RepID=A0A8H4QRC0_9AGAR|nr:hypothetical protein D9613_012393 [Agrocybe pediades]
MWGIRTIKFRRIHHEAGNSHSALGTVASVYDEALATQATSSSPDESTVRLSELVAALEIMGMKFISPTDQVKAEEKEIKRQEFADTSANDLADAMDETLSVADSMSDFEALGPSANPNQYEGPPPSPASSSRTETGFFCPTCKSHVKGKAKAPLSVPNDPHWVVTAGTRVGVFKDWSIAYQFVTGVSRSCFKRYESYEEAKAAYDHARASGAVRVLPSPY